MINLSSACPKPASQLECWIYLYLSDKTLEIANMMVIETRLPWDHLALEASTGSSILKNENSSCFRALKHLYICLSAEINANKRSTQAKVQPSQSPALTMHGPLKWQNY